MNGRQRCFMTETSAACSNAHMVTTGQTALALETSCNQVYIFWNDLEHLLMESSSHSVFFCNRVMFSTFDVFSVWTLQFVVEHLCVTDFYFFSSIISIISVCSPSFDCELLMNNLPARAGIPSLLFFHGTTCSYQQRLRVEVAFVPSTS